MVIANEKIDPKQLSQAEAVILSLQKELPAYIKRGHGPFLAAIFDAGGNLIAKEANTVVMDGCSHNHAEMNTIKKAEQVLKTYDLTGKHLSLYVTSEPCMMCLGGIMWSGIEAVYYGVSSKRVEEITGFDEGFKPDWLAEFEKRGIRVYGQIAVDEGEKVLKEYVDKGNPVYQPERK